MIASALHESGTGMSDRELMRVHVEALFTRDAAGRLLKGVFGAVVGIAAATRRRVP